MESDYRFYQRIRICPHCKKASLYGNEKLCPECRAYFANWMSKQRITNNERIKQLKNESYRRTAEYRNANNLCTKCGKPRTDGYKTCSVCRARNTNYYRNKRNAEYTKIEYRLKNGLCRFCNNEKLDGYNVCRAHYDNMVSMSRSEKQVQNRRNLIDNKILF